jgi:pimeloyl-ACP methyl ester carboxylesterase
VIACPALWALSFLVLVDEPGAGVYLFKAQGFDRSILREDDRVSVSETPEAWVFAPRSATPGPTALLFQPGGLVEPAAYAPLARAVAEKGHRVFLAKRAGGPAPIEAQKRAGVELGRAVRRANPDVVRWAVGGHSLGGAIAAASVRDEPGAFAGLILIGTTHPRDFDLTGYPGDVTQVVATNDGVAPVDRVEANRHRLPGLTTRVRIEGGNHAQFGDYGAQPGDRKADIDRGEQQALAAKAIDEALRRADEIARPPTNP